MPKKNLTIDDLAVIVKDEFDNVNKQFSDVNKRFDNVDKRFNEVNNRLENIELKLSNVAYRFELEELVKRIKILEKKVGLK
ncbi:MAG: hypothetical protein ABIG60_00235 [Patescibacteria group bacterium]